MHTPSRRVSTTPRLRKTARCRDTTDCGDCNTSTRSPTDFSPPRKALIIISLFGSENVLQSSAFSLKSSESYLSGIFHPSNILLYTHIFIYTIPLRLYLQIRHIL